MEATRLRQQVALLHKWCSSSSAPLFTDLDPGFPDAGIGGAERDREDSWDWYDWDPLAGGSAGKSQRRAGARGGGRQSKSTHRDSQADPWEDDELSPASVEDARGRRARRGSQYLGDGHVGEDGAGHMRKRLEELATLRALRRTFEAQRRSGTGQHEAPAPVHAAVARQDRHRDGHSRSSRAGHASEAPSGREREEGIGLAGERGAATDGGAEAEAHLAVEEADAVGQPALPSPHLSSQGEGGQGSLHQEGSDVPGHGGGQHQHAPVADRDGEGSDQ